MPSSGIQAAVDWIRGDDAFLAKPVAPEIGRKHVTELLGQHPFHPFNPELLQQQAHMCYQQNLLFFQCMTAMEQKDAGMPLHMKHVNCYHPYKTDLMKCLVQFRKQEKEKLAANVTAAVTGSGESSA
jgi:hypothetical protein